MSTSEDLAINKNAERPTIKCVYHPDQIVTNFCSSQECQHPLCPVCVAHHINEHKSHRDYAEFETYNEVLDKVNLEINDFLKQLSQYKTKVNSVERGITGQEETLKRVLNVAHNKAKVLLDDYFRALESELDQSLKMSRERYQTERLKTVEEIQRQAEISLNYAEGLYKSDKSVRSLLTYLHNNVKKQNEHYLSNLKDVTDYKTIQVTTDSSKLHEIHVLLSKYVEISNVSLKDYKPELFQNQQEVQRVQNARSNSHTDFSRTQPVFTAIHPPIVAPPTHLQQQIPARIPPPNLNSRIVSPSVPAVVYDIPPNRAQSRLNVTQPISRVQVPPERYVSPERVPIQVNNPNVRSFNPDFNATSPQQPITFGNVNLQQSPLRHQQYNN